MEAKLLQGKPTYGIDHSQIYKVKCLQRGSSDGSDRIHSMLGCLFSVCFEVRTKGFESQLLGTQEGQKDSKSQTLSNLPNLSKVLYS